jgi:hypothetical protein
MTGRLPFTLTPLDGEPFEVWLHAYAARLDTSADHLAAALGLPGRPAHGQVTEPSPAQQAAIRAATGLKAPAIAGMFTVRRPVPSPQLIRAWMPQQVTRFCPSCLAEDPAAMPAAWSVPVTFFCLRHDQVLAGRCPHCGRQPARLRGAAQSRLARCSGQDGCAGRLDAASPPGCAAIPAARTAQQAISHALASVRDPAGTAATRRIALDGLTDLAVITSHLAIGDQPRPQAWFTPDMLNAGTIPAAFALLTGTRHDHQTDPLAVLATRIPDGTLPTAVLKTWGRASPALRARIAHARDDRVPRSTGSGTPPPCPNRASPRPARTALPTWPPSALPGCPTSSGPTGRCASPATPPSATSGSGPSRWPACCSRTATCQPGTSPPWSAASSNAPPPGTSSASSPPRRCAS